MISITNLTVSYNKSHTVIDSLNLFLGKSEIHGIVGLNGAGKTSLFNAIYGLKKIDAGTIHYNKNPITKKVTAYLETENFFYSNITGREYLSLFKNRFFDVDEWNKLFSLPLNQVVDEYSTGMRKKLALLRILKQDKPFMIMDEPFNGLDVESCRIIRAVLLRLKEKGKIIIITSHVVETLTNLCDRISYLEKGKIRFTKDKNDFVKFQQDLFDSIESNAFGIISKLI